MSDKSPRQSMSKKSGKSIKEKRAEKRNKGIRGDLLREDPPDEEEVTLLRAGRDRFVGEGERAPAAAPPGPHPHSGRRPPGPDHARARLRRAVRRRPTRRWASTSPGSRRATQILADSDVVLLPKPQHSDVAALGPGQVLWGWPHCVQDYRAHPARDRPAADPDRLRGDEPLDPGRSRRPARVPQEQRARRLLLGDPRTPAGGPDRRLRPPPDRGGDRVRRHRARRRDRAQRARRAPGRGADQPRRGRGGVADPLGADPAVRPRAGRRAA